MAWGKSQGIDDKKKVNFLLKGNMMAREKKTTSDAVKILHRRYINGKPRRERALAKERERADIAQQIYDRRTKAGLTQAALAKKVGTTASVIRRIESADYEQKTFSETFLDAVYEGIGAMQEGRELTRRTVVKVTPAQQKGRGGKRK